MYFDSYITGKRIQQLRKTKGLTQEQFAVKLNISDRHLGKIERGEGTASIDLLVEVAISLNTTLDFLILGVLDTPRERELNAQIKKQHQKIQIIKNKLSNLIDAIKKSRSDSRLLFLRHFFDESTKNRNWQFLFLRKIRSKKWQNRNYQFLKKTVFLR